MLLTPGLFSDDPNMKLELCNLRSVVETALGIVGNFRISSGKFRGNYVQQAMAVTLCYELTQWRMMRSLLRPDHLPKALQLAFYEASDKVLNASIEEMAALWNEAWIKAGYDSKSIFRLNEENVDSIVPPPPPRPPVTLSSLKVAQLREICSEMGLSKTGVKAELITRIEYAELGGF